MKANYKKNLGTRYQALTAKERRIIQEEVDRDFEKRNRELYLECQNDIACQLTAAVLVTLEQWYDFEPNDLKKFFERLNNTYEDLSGVGFVKAITPTDLVDHVKEKIGIDLEKEISVELR
jgi:hypothetical protein